MPLPGNVGFSQRLISHQAADIKPVYPESQVFSSLSNHERQIQILEQSNSTEDVRKLNMEEIEELLMDVPQASGVLECVAQDCPKVIQKGTDLFWNNLLFQ